MSNSPTSQAKKSSTDTKRNLYAQIIRLGLPILIGQVGMIVTGFADTIMVGRYSTAALASASFVNNLFNVAIFACVGFTYGITPLVGSLFGQKRKADIGALMRTALIVNLCFSLLVTAIMAVVYIRLEHLGQPQELLPLIRPYFLIYLAGIVPIAVFNVFAQWSYAINNTRMPMWIILSANLLNVAGNWLLIHGHCGFPELGLTGAGLATFAARIMCPAAIMIIFFLRRHYSAYREGFLRARITGELVGRVNRTSWPVSLQMTFESGSFTAAAVMTGWIGAIELAAFQIIVIVGTLGFCVYYSMAAAVSVLVANAAGVSDRRLMRRTAMAGYVIILALAAAASLFFMVGGERAMHLFSEDPKVLTLAVTLIPPLVIYQFGDATQITFANALRGTSRVMPMLWIAFVSYVVIGVPATWLLGFPCGMGAYGIILSFSVSLFIAAGLFLNRFLAATRPGR